MTAVACRHGFTIACVQCQWELCRMRGLGNDFIIWPDRLEELASAANSLGALPWWQSPWVAKPTDQT